MRHRGRHRRRRRGRALRGFLTGTALALTAAATLISASQATVTDDGPGGLKPLTSAAETVPLGLTEELVPQASLDRLAGAMGRPVGVGAVLAGADHTLRDGVDCTSDERAALPVSPAATRAYCWNPQDTDGWRPGAVTTSGDADDDGVWGTNRVILSAWSRSGGTAADRGLARVAFVDANDLGHLSYTWALLAVPVDGGRDYRGLVSHVSGMVWYQDKLLVTADDGDRSALYVYDMNRVQRATVESEAVGRVPGGWSAHGARYVLPAIAGYRLSDAKGAAHPATVSLDRSTAPDSLVAGEWTLDDGDRDARLWRWPFSTLPGEEGLLAADDTGLVQASEAYATEVTGLRGVLSYAGGWYVTRAAEAREEHGELWRQAVDPDREDDDGDASDGGFARPADGKGGDPAARPALCDDAESHRCWSPQTESLSYWQETGEVWTQSERVLFALPLMSLTRAVR
ncbi:MULTISPECIES: hypothetical protein [Streptomyces]|uniref:hypothetical protein n=1 Tax=Streptomyces TaxID=1883 RepID=UPI0015878191|nr:hypothetical protein [Streptomyces sp. CAI-85]MBO7938459.1 hypothetical protein [Streptomyces sp. S9]NUV59711.1 hypothetical protein [Streptomyces sp. CAI-85]